MSTTTEPGHVDCEPFGESQRLGAWRAPRRPHRADARPYILRVGPARMGGVGRGTPGTPSLFQQGVVVLARAKEARGAKGDHPQKRRPVCGMASMAVPTSARCATHNDETRVPVRPESTQRRHIWSVQCRVCACSRCMAKSTGGRCI